MRKNHQAADSKINRDLHVLHPQSFHDLVFVRQRILIIGKRNIDNPLKPLVCNRLQLGFGGLSGAGENLTVLTEVGDLLQSRRCSSTASTDCPAKASSRALSIRVFMTSPINRQFGCGHHNKHAKEIPHFPASLRLTAPADFSVGRGVV